MLALTLAFIFSVSSWSQNVIKRGKTFVDTTTVVRQEAQKTEYTYQKGDSVWSVYISSKGKVFIIRYSKRTGRAYRQYLPNITQKINDESKSKRD